ncbi:MAG: transketolase, partial [Myxococcota bacterium]|nr:transketolase [Myxococcota bacterium]
MDRLCVNTVKGLAMDAVQAANSGHPGMPMGMADIAHVLWSRVLCFDPSDASWPNRDRVILSNGHGSMLLYSMLHLTGTSLELEDLRRFRQWGSATAGHPEYGMAAGIETTTGPLGQGVGNAVGMALAERWLNARFGDDLVDHHTWVFCGDGCMMEGITAEAASLAGHLRLGKLQLLYDDNSITIDGATDLAFSEDVGARFEALGWHVQRVDGHDHAAILAALTAAREETERPSLVCFRTRIGHGAATLEGSNKTHGAALGEQEVRATKLALGMDPEQSFVVPPEVLDHYRRDNPARQTVRKAWEARLQEHPQRELWDRFHAAPDHTEVQWPEFGTGKLATRKASHRVIQAISEQFQNLLGGSADLAGSNGSLITDGGDVGPNSFDQRNLHFGIREHGMAAICNGMSLHGGILPYCATVLVFHDYMRPAVRLAALMEQPVVFVYTHDSVHVGEDGPTHQPIEHVMSMRTMPNLWVVRPAD